MKKDVVIITNPMIAANRSAEVTISKFLRVIHPLFKTITIIGGNITVEPDVEDVKILSLPIFRAENKIKRALDIIGLQFKMTKLVRLNIRENQPVYFWIGDKMILPYFAAKKKGADIRYFVYGNVLKEGGICFFTRLSGRLIAYMANHADSVCVESLHVLKEWNGLIDNNNVRVIHLYTHVNESDVLPKRENIIGMLCRLTAGKHVVESILAFCQVHSQHPEYRMEIIGSGRQEQECRELIRSMNAEKYIKMIGWVEHDQIADKTKKWKYLLFPSDTEGMPNSVLEMMGQGIPAIASPVGGINDIISHGETGWLLNDLSVNGIKNSLLQAIEDVYCYNDMSKRARNLIAGEYNLSGARRTASENC